MLKEISYNSVSKAINNWAQSELERRGLIFDPEMPTFMQLDNFLSKCILKKPRKVSMSKAFQVPHEHINGFNNLKSVLTKGEDANPYLSRKLYDSSFVDGLLDQFNCFHFHLGETKKGKFIKGTKFLALAIVNDDEVFFIEVKPHGSSTWNNKSVLEIVHEERGDLIKDFKVKMMMNIAPKISSETDIQELKDAGFNFAVTLDDGTSYMPAKFGQVTTNMTNPKDRICPNLSVTHILKLQSISRNICLNINKFIENFRLMNFCIITDIKILDLKLNKDSNIDQLRFSIKYFSNFMNYEDIFILNTNSSGNAVFHIVKLDQNWIDLYYYFYFHFFQLKSRPNSNL
ncbi:hypothetical protein [Acinetobacter guerrae]|uniref:hypothetical protein n=1 Tax=Acinetobacter guerrae TaxID=1843371 RepID=UPI00165718A4|nr:hypothetical protein [Acinetobacter guerrae]